MSKVKVAKEVKPKCSKCKKGNWNLVRDVCFACRIGSPARLSQPTRSSDDDIDAKIRKLISLKSA